MDTVRSLRSLPLPSDIKMPELPSQPISQPVPYPAQDMRVNSVSIVVRSMKRKTSGLSVFIRLLLEDDGRSMPFLLRESGLSEDALNSVPSNGALLVVSALRW